jgi:hypothetical protein
MKYLFLNNNEAKALIALATGQRISFQFYHDSSNDLTLCAWPKKLLTKTNVDADRTVLHIGKDTTTNIDGKDVLLGNLHLGPNHFPIFKSVCESNKYPYISFYPIIGQIDSSTIFHIYYDIYGSDGETFDIEKAKLLQAFITTTKNPSPPRQAT